VNIHDAWGKGRVELVEIPTRSDANDNVVAYWVPEQLPELGKPISFAYRLHWYGDDPTRPPGGRVVSTRRDHAGTDDLHRFVVDFDGRKLQSLPAETVLRGVITVASGPNMADVVEQHVVKNVATGGWRLVFKVKTKTNDPTELRAYLDYGGEALTETWSYVIRP
jgi:glucans biosynthesis protein